MKLYAYRRTNGLLEFWDNPNIGIIDICECIGTIETSDFSVADPMERYIGKPVLVRDGKVESWGIAILSRIDNSNEFPYWVSTFQDEAPYSRWRYCKPFEEARR